MLLAGQKNVCDKCLYTQTFVAPKVSRETGKLADRANDDFSGVFLAFTRGSYLRILFEKEVDYPALCCRHRR